MKVDPDIAKIASQAASIVLTARGDDTIDLNGTHALAPAMSEHLKAAFLGLLTPRLDQIEQGPAGQSNLLRLMMDRIATLEADLFLIKSSLASGHGFVAGQGTKYVDPLLALRDADNLRRSSTTGRVSSLTVKLDKSILGHGWHEIETRPDGNAWRWSGPALEWTLVLPRLGPERHKLSWDFEVIDRRIVESIAIAVDGRPLAGVKPQFIGPNSGRISFVTEPAATASGFLFLAVKLAATISPQCLGHSDDQRQLGMGLHAISIELA